MCQSVLFIFTAHSRACVRYGGGALSARSQGTRHRPRAAPRRAGPYGRTVCVARDNLPAAFRPGRQRGAAESVCADGGGFRVPPSPKGARGGKTRTRSRGCGRRSSYSPNYFCRLTENLGLYSRSFHSVFHNPWSRIYCPFCDSLLSQPNQPFYLIIDRWKVCDVEVDGRSLAVQWRAL